ncbi:glycosyltransferase [bacterium]|nr:glycosyltransferase [bacterium]
MTSRATPLHIVNLNHLVWERNLFQRPQQLMTRFAQNGDQVDYFVLVGFRRFMEMRRTERLLQLRPNLMAQHIPFLPLTRFLPMLESATRSIFCAKARAPLAKAPVGQRILWIQNPAYADLITRIPHDLLVYDVMDPYSEFESASSRATTDENRILAKADVVFTGGRSLHSLIEGRHGDIHCFPSGIDFAHFSRGASEGEIPADLKPIRGPILGYFGAVDERIDWELLRTVCRERSHWSIVFLGPLVADTKIPLTEPNFHYLGPKPYDRLPEYLRGFDVCLIPWLQNNLTRFMSPTKTPEYLASGRPVVSTPIPDVSADYAEEAFVADSPQRFIEQCTAALLRGKGPARKPPQSRTWEEIATAMREIIVDRLAKKLAR